MTSPFYPGIGLSSLHQSPGVMPESHRHLEVELNFVESGSMTYLAANGLYSVSAGGLVLFWGAYPHRVVEVSEDSSFYCIYIPFGQFLVWELPARLQSVIMNGRFAIDVDREWADTDRLVFAQWHHDISHPDEESETIVYLELEARLRRLARNIDANGNGTVPDGPRKQSSELVKVQTMIATIASRYAEELTVIEIAESAGLHPKYAMSIFNKAMGTTIHNYLQHYRLCNAQRMLATSDLKIIDIAYASGFGSVSRFYEVFGQVCGESPTDYRQSIALKRAGKPHSYPEPANVDPV
jgi:AraC-like DNA-binding protein